MRVLHQKTAALQPPLRTVTLASSCWRKTVKDVPYSTRSSMRTRIKWPPTSWRTTSRCVSLRIWLCVCMECLNHTMRTVFMSFRVRRSWSCLWTTSSRSSASYGTLYDALSDVSWQWPSRNSNWTWTSTARQSTRSSWFCLVSRTQWVECRINSIVLECSCTVCNLSFLPKQNTLLIKSYLCCNIYICKTLKTDVRHTVPFERSWILLLSKRALNWLKVTWRHV